jgi:hypothetical protein
VHVEELVVEVDNGRKVVVVQAAVPRSAHVGKWPNKLHAAWEDSSLNPPCGGRQRVPTGGLGWRQGAVEGGASFWRLGQQADIDGGRGGAGDGKEEERAQQGNKGEGRWKWLGASVGWARGGQGGARDDVRAVSADAFWAQI